VKSEDCNGKRILGFVLSFHLQSGGACRIRQACGAGDRQRGRPLHRARRCEKATACHDGAEYQAALKVFGNAAKRDLRIVEGLA
jgi:hypothetical protein